MVSSEDHSKLLEYMPLVHSYQNEFDSLNSLLGKTTLTGKISSLSIAENLFEYMEETKEKFTNLQTSLINILLEENFNKVNNEITLVSKMTLDILVRSLSERAADVAILAKDTVVNGLLMSESLSEKEKENFHDLLHQYLKKYTVYSDVLVIDKNGTIIANYDENLSLQVTTDPLLAETLKSTAPFVETYRKSELSSSKDAALIYSAPVRSGATGSEEVIGIVCLVTKFKEELCLVFDKLLGESNEIIVSIMDMNNNIVASSNQRIFSAGNKLGVSKREGHHYTVVRGREYVLAESQAGTFFDYTLNEWKVFGMHQFSDAFHAVDDEDFKVEEEILENSSLISRELKQVIEDAENINEDLSDVVINGEIIASKKRSYELNPVLDNVRLISNKISDICFESIKDLQTTVIYSYMKDIKFLSGVAINVMDRSLYERVNNCRWWALKPIFRDIMTKPHLDNSDIAKLEETLAFINSLYKVYSNLFIFDDNGIVVAVSSQAQQHMKGKSIDKGILSRVMGSQDSQRYFVTDFGKTRFYGDKRTYVFYGTIKSSDRAHKPIGGIGVVFDAEAQLTGMLHDVLPEHDDPTELFGLFVNKNQMIIASTSPNVLVGETLEIEQEFYRDRSEKGFSEFCTFRGDTYLVGCKKSSSYREYKKADGHANDVYSFIFKKIITGEESLEDL